MYSCLFWNSHMFPKIVGAGYAQLYILFHFDIYYSDWLYTLFQDTAITPEFEELTNTIMCSRDFNVTYGVTIQYSGSPVSFAQQGISMQDPRAYIFKMLQQEGLRVVDLFLRMDEDGSRGVSREEFKNAIIRVRLIVYS